MRKSANDYLTHTKFSISFKNRRRSDRIKNIILKAAGMDGSFQGSRGRGKSVV